jgi:formate dehydrogenase major subunit
MSACPFDYVRYSTFQGRQKGGVALVELSRRDFLKVTGAGTAGVATAVALSTIPDGTVVAANKKPLEELVEQTQTICCYCSVGCGAIVTRRENPEFGEVIRIEGDPDHPINKGSLCPKGQAMYQIHSVKGQVDSPINDQRVTKPLYRAPYSGEWVEKTWDWMIETIAARVKDTRDRHFRATDTNADGNVVVVNRNEGMGSFGGGELDNEECYLLAKMSRALGVVYLEHCARL